MTADQLAVELETSKRTIYRDIADLMGQRVPIRGEAGIGYVLDAGFDLPPLMLTPDEIEAAVLGAQWVARRADPALAKAAEDLIAKIAASVPERLRPYVLEPVSGTPPVWNAVPDTLDMPMLRMQIRSGRKIAIGYRDEQGLQSQCKVWPITIGYLDTVRLLIAWCELRSDFRHFRTDRIATVEFLDERYPERPAALRSKWRSSLQRAANATQC